MEHWDAIEDAYHVARGLGDDDRSRFLDDRCGSDAVMRRQIEVLLAEDNDLESFLNAPVVASAAEGRLRPRTTADLTGQRVGTYEVLELIGSGGMGDVYRARDTKLGRDVALKALPGHLAPEPERRARFEREAQVLASLNHPNIAAIYGFEEFVLSADSWQPGVRVLALELIEGPTLADRIAQGPIAVDEAVPIARQITEAIAAAHERGIVHRDLKPANIKLRPDGVVKLLDFGLAKVVEPSESLDTSASPGMTVAGSILGTAAYMSPEQAKGRRTDKRTDVWAFGCVLYEMLTGRRAFAGEDVSDTIAAVLRGDPDWTLLPATAPPSVRALIEGCLHKDGHERIADISVARFLLSGRQVDSEAAPPQKASRMPRWRRAAPFAAMAVISATFSSVVVWRLASGDSAATNMRPMRFPVDSPRGTSFGTREQPSSPVISPDGARLVFRVLGQGQPVLAIRSLDTLEAQVLSGTEGAQYPFWSPESRRVAFFASGKLWIVGIGGGPVREICPAPTARGGTWNRQGSIVFGDDSEGLSTVPENGGEPSRLTTLEKNETSHRSPQFLSDGRRFLYFSPPDALYLGSIDGGPSRRILTNEFGGKYAPPGYLLFQQGNVLLAQRFDADRVRVLGEPVRIGEGLQALPGSGYTPFSISDNDVLVYAVNPPDNVKLAWVDRTGRPLHTVGPFPFERYANPELSPDGKRIAVEGVPASLPQAMPYSNQDVWVIDEGGNSTLLTFDSAPDEHPIWSPDSREVVFLSRRPGAAGLVRKEVGNEKREKMVLPGENVSPWDWSSKGIVYDNGGQAADLWLLPLEGDRTAYPLVEAPSLQIAAQFSPNERWFAYQSNELGRAEIFVNSFPPSAANKRQVSTEGGFRPRWRRDGKELFYLAADGKLMAVSVDTDRPTFWKDVPRPLFPTELNTLYARLRTYSVSNDGNQFLVTRRDDPGATPSIETVLHWQALVR